MKKKETSIQEDLELLDSGSELKTLRDKYQESLKIISTLQKKNEIASQIKQGTQTAEIVLRTSSKKSEATAVLLASDWHVEEGVNPEKVNNLNSYNLEIAEKRSQYFFKNGLKLVKIQNKDIEIKTVIIGLLGDFISGNIHEELLESCLLRPIDAILFAQKLIISGLEYILKNSKYEIIVPCVVGNHSRVTAKIHYSTEQENSLEYFMYHNIAQYFKTEKRIKFLVPNSDDCYVDVYKYKLRFVHGHQFRYKDGVGGVTIPLIKWLNIQNGNIKADYTCIGHYHTFFSGKNFICNGSLIGFNAYGKKFGYEPPLQGFFLIDSRFGKTIQAPILLDEV